MNKAVEIIDNAVGTAKELVAHSTHMHIRNIETAMEARDIITAISNVEKEIIRYRKSLTTPMDRAKETLMDAFRTDLKTIVEAQEAIRDKLLQFCQAHPSDLPKGVSVRSVAKPKDIDLFSLLVAISIGEAPIEAVMPNMDYIEKAIAAGEEIHGVDVQLKQTLVVRGGQDE